MDTIETIIRNAHALSEAHVDWSLDGGVVWLLGSLVFSAIGTALASSWSK